MGEPGLAPLHRWVAFRWPQVPRTEVATGRQAVDWLPQSGGLWGPLTGCADRRCDVCDGGRPPPQCECAKPEPTPGQRHGDGSPPPPHPRLAPPGSPDALNCPLTAARTHTRTLAHVTPRARTRAGAGYPPGWASGRFVLKGPLSWCHPSPQSSSCCRQRLGVGEPHSWGQWGTSWKPAQVGGPPAPPGA